MCEPFRKKPIFCERKFCGSYGTIRIFITTNTWTGNKVESFFIAWNQVKKGCITTEKEKNWRRVQSKGGSLWTYWIFRKNFFSGQKERFLERFLKNEWKRYVRIELISHENSRYLLKIYVIKSRKKGPTSNCLLNPGLRLSALTPRMSFAGIFANSPNRFLWPSISSFQMLAFSYWRLRPVTELTAISLPR